MSPTTTTINSSTVGSGVSAVMRGAERSRRMGRKKNTTRRKEDNRVFGPCRPGICLP